jgi:hypothetical protein
VHVHDDSMTHALMADGLVVDGIMLRHTLSDTGAPVALVHCTTLVCVPGVLEQPPGVDAAHSAAVQVLHSPMLHATMALRHMKRLQARFVDCVRLIMNHGGTQRNEGAQKRKGEHKEQHILSLNQLSVDEN